MRIQSHPLKTVYNLTQINSCFSIQYLIRRDNHLLGLSKLEDFFITSAFLKLAIISSPEPGTLLCWIMVYNLMILTFMLRIQKIITLLPILFWEIKCLEDFGQPILKRTAIHFYFETKMQDLIFELSYCKVQLNLISF